MPVPDLTSSLDPSTKCYVAAIVNVGWWVKANVTPLSSEPSGRGLAKSRGGLAHIFWLRTRLRGPSYQPISTVSGALRALSPSLTPASHECPPGGVSANKDRLMAKEELLTIEGVVDEILPDGRFGVMLDNQCRIIAYTAGRMRRYRIRSIVGDRVHVEMTPYDLSKGRIVFREKLQGHASGPKRRSFRR